MVVPALPPGSYEFFCLPHRAYDMRGRAPNYEVATPYY